MATLAEEVLVLTDLALPEEWEYGRTEGGNRAFVGFESWHALAPVTPSSLFWKAPAKDSIVVGEVLPLGAVVYEARLNDEGVKGRRIYVPDIADDPVWVVFFDGRRVPCS